LALALRGQIDDSNYDKQVAGVQAELESCKKIDPARPDAYFNEGILTQEYKAKGAGALEKTLAVYDQAKQIFQSFLEKASGKSEYDGAAKKAKERLQDIDDTETFLKAGPAPSASPPPAASDGGAPNGSGDTDGGVSVPGSAANGGDGGGAPAAASVGGLGVDAGGSAK
jgi:hypothetical protein